jgi:prolyl-tRNA synthetase
VHQKIVQIVREEMDAIGGQEMLMPVLTPVELWQHTKRDYIQELFRLKDRNGRDYVLPMTHEETVTWHAKEIQSYRQLPQILYHFSIKERDEQRPRGGLLRLREFIMKDAYSFDRNEEGLDLSFRKHGEAYHRIFDRVGLEYYEVQAESGMMGGKESLDYLAPSGSGENVLVTCERGDYAADQEIAQGVPRAPDFPPSLDSPEAVDTPGVTTIEALADFLGIDSAATAKAMPVVKLEGGLVLALIRGDDKLEDAKLASALASDFRPATEDEIREAFGADPGSIGAVGFQGEIVADEMLREGQFVAGANETGRHLRGVQQGRDYQARFADLRRPREGDRCPNCGGALSFQTAIEVGHIFKFGSRYSEPLGATFLDEDGKEKPLVGGSYGIGPGRIMAAVVEQRHDEHGIVWPRAVAPYDVHVVVLPGLEERAADVEAAVAASGLDVLVDDRDQRAGEKFADADLIGIPQRITVGRKTLEDGAVDVRDRATGEERRVPIDELGEAVGEDVAVGA